MTEHEFGEGSGGAAYPLVGESQANQGKLTQEFPIGSLQQILTLHI